MRKFILTASLLFLLKSAGGSQSVESLMPGRAYEMTKSEATYLVDVRSIAEYVLIGHPTMAHNIPITFWSEQERGFTANPNFIKDLQARFKPDDTLIFLCRSGGRSRKAAESARLAGFKRTFNISEGFEGELDSDGYRTIGGWKNSGLPYTYKIDPSLAYPDDKGSSLFSQN